MFPDSQQEIAFELQYPSSVLDMQEKGLLQMLWLYTERAKGILTFPPLEYTQNCCEHPFVL